MDDFLYSHNLSDRGQKKYDVDCLGALLTYQFLLQPSESNQRPCEVLPKLNVIGPARNTKMIDRCHTSNKSDEHTLEFEDTDTLRGGTLEK